MLPFTFTPDLWLYAFNTVVRLAFAQRSITPALGLMLEIVDLPFELWI